MINYIFKCACGSCKLLENTDYHSTETVMTFTDLENGCVVPNLQGDDVKDQVGNRYYTCARCGIRWNALAEIINHNCVELVSDEQTQ